MNKFNRISAAVLAGTALYGASGASHGLGYGRPTSRAILGETLSVSVPVRVESSDDVSNECVAADVYFGDDKVGAQEVQAVLVPGAGRDRIIKVTTRKIVNEPVITVYLAAGCAAKITSKFVAFADPPSTVAPSVGLNVQEPAPVAYASQPGKVSVGGVTIETGSTIAAAPLDPVDAGPRVVRRAKKAAQSGGNKASSAVASKGDSSGGGALQGAPSLALSSGAQAQMAQVADEDTLSKHHGGKAGKGQLAPERKGGGGERLVLDPMDVDATILPTLRMSPGVQSKPEGDEPSPEVKERRAAAAALWLAMNSTPEQLARDRQRVHELEQRLANLQQESDKSHQQVAQLQARVREAESGQSSPLVVYALGGLVALLGAALAALFLKGRGKKTGADWWKSDPTSSVDSVSDEAPEESALERTLARFRPGAPPVVGDAHHGSASAEASAVHAGSTTTAPAPEPAREPPPTFFKPNDLEPAPAAVAPAPTARAQRPPATEPVREVSVEELIDLEQQAEFFIVLGQDDAALDLLESHVQSTTGASPLPFLKLLEIYQRLGKRQDYERVQSEFNQRFNGYAPAWESDLQQGHNLSEYPGIVERLQDLWPSPAKAMDVLERSLTRPDAEVETFDLPAYRELLFLYAVARDLSERESETREVVDLDLPLVNTDGGTVVSSEPESIEPLMATRPVKAQFHAQPTISLDLSLDDLEPVDFSDQPSPAANAGNQIEFEHVEVTKKDHPADHQASPPDKA